MCASACHLPEARNLSLSAADHQQLHKNHNDIINGTEKQPVRASLPLSKHPLSLPIALNLSIQLSIILMESKPFRSKEGK